jgi:zeta-carotene desaturase
VERARYHPALKRWTAECLEDRYDADAIIFALPFQGMLKLLPDVFADADAAEVAQLTQQLGRFGSSSITGVHFWLDRAITDLPHAALLDSPIHWLFNKSRLQLGTRGAQSVSYIEVVISASSEMVAMSRQQVLDMVLKELARFFPAISGARVLKNVVVKEINATFRAPAGGETARPRQIAPWPRAFLAGDWTATGWPSTMEGAVRSGHLAAEALTSMAGRPQRFLQPDMEPTGLMRLWGKRKQIT